MSAYAEALRRYRSAVAQGKDSAELDEAARVLQRFAIDPYYAGNTRQDTAITEREAA